MGGDQILILTPTPRLARAESLRQAQSQVRAGRQAWRRPQVLAFPAWLSQMRDDWFLASDDNRVPISGAQALVLWQEVIDREIFIGEPRVAEMAASAWRRIHEYRLPPPERWNELHLNEDSRRFRDWAARFQALCDERGLVDEWTFAASLPERIGQRRIELPQSIHMVGFELAMTPLQQAVIEATEAAGTGIEHARLAGDPAPPARVTAFDDGDGELQAAAAWARARLEANPEQTLAVVVSGLGDRLSAVERIFRRVFDPPGFALEAGNPEPWHVSLGPALARWPLVADALQLLRLDPHQIRQPEAAALLRCPFLAGAPGEEDARACALAELVSRRPYWIHAGQIAWQAGTDGATQLRQRLAEWEALRREHRNTAPPSTWSARFQEELAALGFGRGRGLDSHEYQVLGRFHELLEEFSTLDLVIPRPMSRAQAVRRLNERAAATPFRERNPGVPVEILGVEEALGSRFDGLWITGLDNHTWPSAARRDPLLPAIIQKGVPAATVEGALARARAELDGLLRAAPEVHGSFVHDGDEGPRAPTPLLAACQPVEADPAGLPEPAPIESVPDDSRAPPHAGGALHGGTGVLQRQSDCPFRAFAEWRLGTADLTPPRPGLDGRDRGSLVHQALEHFWRDLDGRDALRALDTDVLESRIGAACRAALEAFAKHSPLALGEAGVELETACLKRSITRWLAIERDRTAFVVTALERPVELRFGDLVLTGKIDRIDEIEGGGSLVIDYKTGASSKNGWAPEAPLADVQLPAYAVNVEPHPAAIAFARLRPDVMGFDGLSGLDTGTTGVEIIGQIKGRSKFREIKSWPSLLDDWRHGLDGLAADFQAGRAEVNPRDRQVCRHCHLHALCRIYERTWMDMGSGETA